jgi:hypothetical protein
MQQDAEIQYYCYLIQTNEDNFLTWNTSLRLDSLVCIITALTVGF